MTEIFATCLGCGAPLTRTFVDLGFSPLANRYAKPGDTLLANRKYPLHARVCDACLLVQVDRVVPPEDIFSDYAYFSSYSDSWLAHCRSYAAAMIRRFHLNPRSRVIELGSNDGYMLQYFRDAGIEVDIVFLDNASDDKTYDEILEVKKDWPSTYVIVQSRNVGYQKSLAAGLRQVAGDLFVFIDVDCEDPPEMIGEFVDRHEKGGYDIVYGQRVNREEPQAINLARKLFYRVLRAFADEEIILDMAEFALFTNEVREAVITEKSSFPFIRASIGRVGFQRFAIPYTRQRRIAGRSNYNFISMAIFAVAALLSSSTFFLRLPIYVFPLWTLALFAIGYRYVGHPSPLWAVAGALIFALYVGFVLAFIALYVARTYKNVLERPNSFISRRKSILPP